MFVEDRALFKCGDLAGFRLRN